MLILELSDPVAVGGEGRTEVRERDSPSIAQRIHAYDHGRRGRRPSNINATLRYIQSRLNNVQVTLIRGGGKFASKKKKSASLERV